MSHAWHRKTSNFACAFFFQAEDGIRDDLVTGVQTCALPISLKRVRHPRGQPTFSSLQLPSPLQHTMRPSLPSLPPALNALPGPLLAALLLEIGRASCRERV